jgi:hypothetical protein
VPPTTSSPFRFAELAPDDPIGRDDVVAALLDRARAGRFVLLTAPRRFGKTTLVHRLRRVAEGDPLVVIADLQGIRDLGMLAQRLVSAWRTLPAGLPQQVLDHVSSRVAGLSAGGFGVQLRDRDPNDPGPLESVLSVPVEVAERTGRRVLVVLDEFQEIAPIDGADAVIRSQIQHHADQVSYIFQGSEESILVGLFDHGDRPLYGQAERFRLEPFDLDDLASFVSGRFTASGRRISSAALETYLTVTGGHPQRSMRLADQLWHRIGPGGTVDVADVDAALEAVLAEASAGFADLWGAFDHQERWTLGLIVDGRSLFGPEAEAIGLREGTVRAAVDRLRRKRVLREADGYGRRDLEIIDPLLAIWLHRTASAGG